MRPSNALLGLGRILIGVNAHFIAMIKVEQVNGSLKLWHRKWDLWDL